MSELLLGFDILALPQAVFGDPWSLEGPEEYLLRPEIKTPVSVDRLICPSIFSA